MRRSPSDRTQGAQRRAPGWLPRLVLRWRLPTQRAVSLPASPRPANAERADFVDTQPCCRFR